MTYGKGVANLFGGDVEASARHEGHRGLIEVEVVGRVGRVFSASPGRDEDSPRSCRKGEEVCIRAVCAQTLEPLAGQEGVHGLECRRRRRLWRIFSATDRTEERNYSALDQEARATHLTRKVVAV